MSSVNRYPTFEYSQPEEYRFSHDSVFLARRVFELFKDKDLSSLKGLDLCAGCGVIGLDFLYHCMHEATQYVKSFDFIEVQNVYKDHFLKNCRTLNLPNTKLEFINANYQSLLSSDFTKKYDLILCNPPYFQLGQGKLSPSEFKNRCRFFIDSDFKHLLSFIEQSLAPGGQAYILLRDLADHGFNYQHEAQKILSSEIQIKNLGDIRGTDLISLSAPPFDLK